jgi:putative membrane protein
MMGIDMGWNWDWIWWGGLMMVLFWGGLIALVVLAVRGLSSGGTGRGEAAPPHNEPRQTPLEIAQARYAKGEINRDEYETLWRDLQTS